MLGRKHFDLLLIQEKGKRHHIKNSYKKSSYKKFQYIHA